MPDKINLNIKETEFAKAPELVKKEIIKSLGRSDYRIELKDIEFNSDLKKYESSFDLYHKFNDTIMCESKDIEIVFSNSKDRNENDQNMINLIIEKTRI